MSSDTVAVATSAGLLESVTWTVNVVSACASGVPNINRLGQAGSVPKSDQV